jgi:hypothetical protein
MGLECVPKLCYVSSDRTLILHYSTTKTLNYFLLENMGIIYYRPTYYTRTQPYMNQIEGERYHPISTDLNTERKFSLKDKNVNLIYVISKGNTCIFNHQYPVSCLLRIQIDLWFMYILNPFFLFRMRRF